MRTRLPYNAAHSFAIDFENEHKRSMATAETANLEEDLTGARAAGACAMVLFGAAGDLTKRS